MALSATTADVPEEGARGRSFDGVLADDGQPPHVIVRGDRLGDPSTPK